MSLFRTEMERTADYPVKVVHTLAGATAATAANYGSIFTADRDYTVVEAHEIHETASSSGTLNITRDTGTDAPAAGTDLFASTFDLSAAANTLQTLQAIEAENFLARGQRLGLKDGGTLTSGAGVQVTVVLRARQPGA